MKKLPVDAAQGPEESQTAAEQDRLLRLERLLAFFKSEQPAHAQLVSAFTPVFLARERLVQAAASQAEEGAAAAPLQSSTALPVGNAEAQAVALPLLDALAQGFPSAAGQWEALRRSMRASQDLAARLCLARRDNQPKKLTRLGHEHGAEREVTALFAAQALGILAARHAARLPAAEGQGMSMRLCPYCGSRPELSVIHEQEGKRSLLCSNCGRHWRYARTACPFCGTDASNNIRHMFVEGQSDLRAALCETCRHYVLEADIRQRDMPLEFSRALTLIMGHLDALAQEEGALPLSLLAPEVRFSGQSGRA